YKFRTIHCDFDEALLANAEVKHEAKYLQLPSSIPERVHDLAQEVTVGSPSPYLKARAIERYLKTNYIYDFDYIRALEGWEPNDWFLFEEKRGVCANFNSAFVVLCRSVGIPARLVGGYAITPQPGTQVVYADQAHAWSEVQFEHLGWHTFDATGSSSGPLPTVTEITSINPIVQKGYSFNIVGTVQTEDGSPVDAVSVEIFVNPEKDTEGGLLVGEGQTIQGFFEIEATIPQDTNVGEYHVLAHCLGNIRYLESWSDPTIKVCTDTLLNIDLPERVKVEELLVLKGNLTEEFGDPVAEQTINLYLGTQLTSELSTSAAGYFQWEKAFHQAGAYTIKADYQGTEFYLQSSQEAEFQVLAPTLLSLQVPDKATATETLTLEGILIEELTGLPISDQEIKMSIAGEPLEESLKTDDEGVFKLEYAFDNVGRYTIVANFSSVPFYWESSSQTDILISTPTTITLTPPESIEVNRTFLLEGTLADAKTGAPLPSQQISYTIDGETGQAPLTNDEGVFQVEHVFHEEGVREIKAIFAGTPLYWASDATIDLEVLSAAGFPWLYLSIGLALAAASAAILYLYRRHSQHRLILVGTGQETAVETQAAPASHAERRHRKVSLTMEFPQIETPYPDVWGIGDDLEITCRLKGPYGETLTDKTLEIYLGKELIDKVSTDNNGIARLRHIFPEKGQYGITTNFRGEPGIKSAAVNRMVRIVDYREEIVSLFNSLVDWLRSLGLEISTNTTPREMEYLTLKSDKSVPEAALDRAVSCFEEADYSQHPIRRADYQAMYLAQKEINEHAGTQYREP
ncbi:DUF4129 domain-containing transglutaminase family protein, partial [Chloroflexota bacterium]